MLWGIDWLGFISQDSTCNWSPRGEVAMKRKYFFRFSLATLLAVTGVWLIKKKQHTHTAGDSSQGIGMTSMRVEKENDR